MQNISILKKCNKCLEHKSLDCFVKDRTKKDGLATICRPCKRASDNEWRSKNKVRISEYQKKRYEIHKDKILAINRQWKRDNFERACSHSKAWQSRNPDKCKILSKSWFDKNPAKRKFYLIKRRKQECDAMPKWSDHKKIDDLYFTAKRISKETGIKHHVDHIVPIIGKINKKHVVCGLHCESNLRIITAKENLKKSCYEWPDMWK